MWLTKLARMWVFFIHTEGGHSEYPYVTNCVRLSVDGFFSFTSETPELWPGYAGQEIVHKKRQDSRNTSMLTGNMLQRHLMTDKMDTHCSVTEGEISGSV